MFHCRLSFALLAVLPLMAPAQTLLTGNLLTNPGAETGNLSGWTQSGAVGYLADNGAYEDFTPAYMPKTGSYQFVAGANIGASGTLYQTVSLTPLDASLLAGIDSGGINANISFWQQSLFQGGQPDYLQVRLGFRDSNGTSLGSDTTGQYGSTHASGSAWVLASDSFPVPAGTRSILYAIESFRGANGGNYIDALSDDHSLTLSAVPEPSTYALLAGGAVLAGAWWRRRARA